MTQSHRLLHQEEDENFLSMHFVGTDAEGIIITRLESLQRQRFASAGHSDQQKSKRRPIE